MTEGQQTTLMFGHALLDPPMGQFLDWLDGVEHGAIGLDTETTGLDWSDTPRLLTVGDEVSGWAFAIENAIPPLEAVLDRGARGAKVVLHNLGFDAHMLDKVQDGLGERLWDVAQDTYILAHLHKSDQVLKLKPLAEKYLDHPPEEKDLLKAAMRRGKWTWATVPIDLPEYLTYSINDTIITAQLYLKLVGTC